MIITVNVLTAELTLKDGQTITLEDTVRDDIASRVMHELTASRNLVYVGNGKYISPRSVLSAEVSMSQKTKRIPDPCPSGDPCDTLEPPTITVPSGTLEVGVGEEFDPLDGVTATDGYGEPLEVSVELIA